MTLFLEWLATASAAFFAGAGRRLALVGGNERASALLKMTNVKQLFPIFPSLGEAGRGLA